MKSKVSFQKIAIKSMQNMLISTGEQLLRSTLSIAFGHTPHHIIVFEEEAGGWQLSEAL